MDGFPLWRFGDHALALDAVWVMPSTSSLRGATCPPKLNERARKRRSHRFFLAMAVWVAASGAPSRGPAGSERQPDDPLHLARLSRIRSLLAVSKSSRAQR